MAENDHSPYGRGFVAASIVIGAILLCGALLIITGPTSTTAGETAGTTPREVSTPTDPPSAELTAPGTTVPGTTAPATTAPATADPATADPGVASTGAPASGTASACGVPDGDQGVPANPPAVDGWEVSRRVVVPRSTTFGPARLDPDGFRRCFAHSPTGAIFAAYNAIAALADQRKGIATTGKLMVPGPDTDALVRELRKETPEENPDPTQLAGFRVVDASRDRATVTLAMPVESAFVSATLTLVWHHGDWRVLPPAAGESVGAPYSQHRDLDGFVAWSGV